MEVFIMTTRKAYFDTGDIIECTCGKAAFKRHIKNYQACNDGCRVWFKPSAEWQKICQRINDEYAQNLGFVSYDALKWFREIANS